MEVNLTSFNNLSDRKEIPVTIAVHLDPCIKDELLKASNNTYYKQNPIQINGFDRQNPNEIDLSKNEELLKYLVERANFNVYSPISDFILQWETSKGLRITKNKHLQNLTGMFLFFCYSESRSHLYCNSDLSSKFLELLSIYLKFTGEYVSINKIENSISTTKKRKLILLIILFISFFILFIF